MKERRKILFGWVGVLVAVVLLFAPQRLAVDKDKFKKELGDFVKELAVSSLTDGIEVDLKEFSEGNLPVDLEGELKIPVNLEKRLRDATYINEMLRDVKVLGYDMSDVSIVKLGLDYAELNEKFREVWLKGTRAKKTKVQMVIESRRLILESVSGLLGRALDDKTPEISGEIASGLNSLLWDGYDKIKDVLETVDAVEKDPDLDWSDAIKKKIDIRGDFFDHFQTFEENYRAFKDQVIDPGEAYQAFTILTRGMSAKNPGTKIDTVFKMMTTFGGKVPVLGKFLEMYGQVAEEMLKAVGRLGEILRKRQGFCVGTGTTGHIAGTYQDIRSKKFAEQFPNGGTACPYFDEGVYKDIYVDINNQGQLYFWTGSSFIQGLLPVGGIEAVKALIVWLRKTRHASEAADAGFLGPAYNLAPGFLARDRQARDLAEELRTRVRSLAGRLGMCSKEALQKFLLVEGRVKSILDRLNQDTDQVENFPYEDDLFVDRIHDDAIFKSTDEFWTLVKDVTARLNELVVFTIEGKVVDEDGKPQPKMAVTVRPDSYLLKDCSRLTTDAGGGFIATLFKVKEESFEAALQAQGEKKQSDEKKVSVSGTANTYSCALSVEGTPVAFLSLTPAKKTITVGEKIVFKLTAELVDGTTKTIDNSRATWMGAEGGVFVGARAAKAQGVVATYREKQAAASITVSERKPKSIAVTKNVERVTIGLPVSFQAVALFDDGSAEDVTEDPGTVFNPGKELTYPKAGAARVSATYLGVTGSISFVVETGDAKLVITPDRETVVVGDAIAFQVSLVRAAGASEDVTAKCVPPNPEFMAKNVGKFSVTVTYPYSPEQSLAATAVITVNKIDRLIVEPANAVLKLKEARDFTARAVFSDGTAADVTAKASWRGGPRFSSDKPGTYAVSASYGGAAGQATVSVTNEKSDDPCASANVLASIEKLNALVNNIKGCRGRVDQYYSSFIQAVGSMGDKKICNNFKIAYCYANALSNAVRIVDYLLEAEDIAAEILMLYGICPDLATTMKAQGHDIASIIAALGSVKGAGDQSTQKVNAMLGLLNANGCDVSEVIRTGENNVRPDQDPDNIILLDGTPAPVCYDTWIWGGGTTQSKQNWSLNGRAEGLSDFDLSSLKFTGQKQGSVSLPDGARGTFAYTGNNIRILVKRTVFENGKSVNLTYTFIGSDSGTSLLIGTYTVEGSDGRKLRGNWRADKK